MDKRGSLLEAFFLVEVKGAGEWFWLGILTVQESRLNTNFNGYVL